MVRQISSRRPDSCPVCGEETVAQVIYGMPVMTEELERELEEGEVVLGGCTVSGFDPAWECTACGAEIYRTGTPEL